MGKQPKPGTIFAVTDGDYIGSNLVFIKNSTNSNIQTYNFLNLPEMVNISIKRSDFETGLSEKILDIIEIIPEQILDTCIKQYEQNEKNINN